MVESDNNLERVDELLPEEVARLRSALWSKLSEAIALGVFRPKDAVDWEAGFEACTQLDYMESLVAIIDGFVAEGVRVAHQIETEIYKPEFSAQDRAEQQARTDAADYHERTEQILPELKRIVAEVKALRSALEAALGREGISRRQIEWFKAKFGSASIHEKSSVVGEANSLQPDVTIELSGPTDTPATEPTHWSTAEPDDKPEPIEDPKAECQASITYYLAHKEFRLASTRLESSIQLFNLAEYRRLLIQIDKAYQAQGISEARLQAQMT